MDGHVPGTQKALIWPQHVSSPLSKQAQVYQTAMAHYFSAADILPSISPLPSSCCSANFVALRVKETIEQQLIAASERRMGAGWVMDDATAAAVEGRWSALTREPSVTALTDEGQASNIDMRLTVSKTISAAESPSKTLPLPPLDDRWMTPANCIERRIRAQDSAEFLLKKMSCKNTYFTLWQPFACYESNNFLGFKCKISVSLFLHSSSYRSPYRVRTLSCLIRIHWAFMQIFCLCEVSYKRWDNKGPKLSNNTQPVHTEKHSASRHRDP